MSEFSYNFGNYPPGVFDTDPEAPWNQDEPPEPTPDELVDYIFELLREAGEEPQYKGMRLKCWGLYVNVTEE
jgi:hypothetical protein